MSKVFQIVTFDLIGKKLKTFEEMPNLISKPDPKYPTKTIFVDKDSGEEYMRSRLWEMSNSNAGCFPRSEPFLPYFADVTEDTSVRTITPKTYHNCQLMTEKHGGYLQFFHKESGEVLRIALNSNYYTPLNK